MAEDDDDRDSKIPSGRLGRLARVAALTARTAGDLAKGQVKRALGEAGYEAERAAAKRVLETLGTMKGAAMKLGQQLAMDADGLPPEARELMSRLFAQAPRASYADVARVVEQELGAPPEKAFARFEKEALAAASLGQVHRAWLADGTAVAVKIQYPGVAEALRADLDNAALLAKTLGGAGKLAVGVDPKPYYDEIRAVVGAELDYRREAALCAEYAEAASVATELHVPKVIAEKSSAKVLTLEFAEGIPLKAFAESDADAAARWRVGRQMAQAVMVPFLRRHLVHADPHPGNFLVRPDGRLTVLDFGAIKHLSPQFVRGFWSLIEAACEDREPDFLSIIEPAGFQVKGDRAEATRAISAIHDIASRPVRQAEYDWGEGTVIADMRTHFRTHVREVTGVLPPVESIFFYRALGGLAQNLKLVRARGPYRALCQELTGLLPRG